VAVVGIPLDENSSYLRGPARAPAAIRAALHSGSTNLSTELGVDLATQRGWRDAGDLHLTSGAAAMGEIEAAVGALLREGERVLSLGGDHSISYPLVRAHAAAHAAIHGPLTILHLDAHPDLYDELDGSRLSHACPFARILEEGLCRRLVQVGIRTLNPHQAAQAARFGASIPIDIHAARTWRPATDLALAGPLYLSLDLDVLDPAFAPGVSHHEPGGLSVRDVLHIVQGLQVPIVGADIVECNPTRDPLGMTAMVGAKFLKEILGKMLDP
jgi:agmatinase